MKKTFTILLSGLLICGCSHKQASSPAIDRVKVGDTSWNDGGHTFYTLHVSKRDGTSVEGVSITANLPTRQRQIISGDSATLSAVPNDSDGKSVMITVHNAKIQVDSERPTAGGDYPVTLHE